MALEKSVVIDEITVSEKGIVLYREATRIMENDKVLSESYHRSSLVPGDDTSKVPSKVAAICKAAWTKDVVAAYKAATTPAA